MRRESPYERTRESRDEHSPPDLSSRDDGLYSVLDVRRGATADEIKSADRREAMRWHPDTNSGSKTAEERLKQISEAYSIPSDPGKRRQYDATLDSAGTGPRMERATSQQAERMDAEAAAKPFLLRSVLSIVGGTILTAVLAGFGYIALVGPVVILRGIYDMVSGRGAGRTVGIAIAAGDRHADWP